MNRPVRWYDFITFNIYWFGLSSLSQAMTPLIIPLLVQQFVGVESQGTYYGNLRLWTLMVALLVQALMGMLSDRSTLPWGRRRPFIFIGTIGVVVELGLIGFSASLAGIAGYWVLFALIIMQMVFANTAQGAEQGLIPDLIPEEKHGRFSGVKAVFEVPLPVIIVAFTVGKLMSHGQLWASLAVVIAIMIVVMFITMFVPEKRQQHAPSAFDWTPFLRLVFMTVVFAGIILVLGQLVILAGRLSLSLSGAGLVVVFGVLGIAAMVIAVVLGVWASIRIGLGEAIHRTPSFTWWVVSRLAFLIGSTNLASFVVYFLQGRFGFRHEQAAGPASTLTMFVGVFLLISAIPSGYLSDRFGRKPLLILSGLLAIAGTMVVIFAPTLTVVYLGAVLIGLATGQFYSVNWALGTDIVPKDQAGRYLGVSNLAGAGAGAIGAYIGGPIADLITTRVPQMPGMGYTVLFVIYAGLFLLSILALRGVRDRVAVVPA